ncbi:MAG: hypothetical protein AAF916_03100 [Planctomycetota bacterium]
MFPELVTPFQHAFDAAEEGEALVLPFLAGRTEQSLRKPMARAITRAGLTP